MMATADLGRRIIIVGPPGAGKSTLALELSSLLRVPRLMVSTGKLLLDRHEDGTRRITIVGPPGSWERFIEELNSLLHISGLMVGADKMFVDCREGGRHEEIEEVLFDLVREDGWIAEGPYHSIPNHVWDHVWDRAEVVICLDYSRAVLAWRQLKRGWSMKLIRRKSRKRLWDNLEYTLLRYAKDRDGLRGRLEAHRRPNMKVIVLTTLRGQRKLVASLHKDSLRSK